jgi:hypothetical protein
MSLAALESEKCDKTLILQVLSGGGAGDGNRTRVASLEDWNSTIELHPQPETNPSYSDDERQFWI